MKTENILYRRQYRFSLLIFALLSALSAAINEITVESFMPARPCIAYLVITVSALFAMRAFYWKGRFEESSGKGLLLW